MKESSYIGLQKRFISQANLLVYMTLGDSMLVLPIWKLNIFKGSLSGLVAMTPIIAILFLRSTVAFRCITIDKSASLQRCLGSVLVILIPSKRFAVFQRPLPVINIDCLKQSFKHP